MTNTLRKSPEAFLETAVDGEVVLLDMAGGNFFSLTGTAAQIWPLIDGTRDRDALLRDLAATYRVEAQAIADDLDMFLAQLSEAGFVSHG